MAFFRKLRVYTKVEREPWMHVITTKWLDVNKGDELELNVRCRLVGCELARDDLLAATPLLECLKMIIALCASRHGGPNPSRLLAIEVKRAYLYAPARREIYIEITMEYCQPSIILPTICMHQNSNMLTPPAGRTLYMLEFFI